MYAGTQSTIRPPGSVIWARARRAPVSSSMCSSTLIAMTVETGLAEVDRALLEVEDAGLGLRAVDEAPGHGRHGQRVDVGHDMSSQSRELGGELTEPGSDLHHRRAAVGLDQRELEGAVATLVRTGGVLQRAARWPR